MSRASAMMRLMLVLFLFTFPRLGDTLVFVLVLFGGGVRALPNKLLNICTHCSGQRDADTKDGGENVFFRVILREPESQNRVGR